MGLVLYGRIDTLTNEAGPVRLALMEYYPKAGAVNTGSIVRYVLERTCHVRCEGDVRYAD